LLDGELVALDSDGRPSFQLLQNRKTAGATLAYYAFDLLQLNGKPLLEQPLAQRKALLQKLLPVGPLQISVNLEGSPTDIVEHVARFGLEGVIAKRRDSRYEVGKRSGAWLKLKLSPEQEFVIGGYKPALKGIESLIVGYYESGKLVCAGNVRQGLNPRNRIELAALLKPLTMATCPFANLPTAKTGHWGEGITAEKMKDLRWVKPKLVAQVAFTEWTQGLQLRHATYKGLRDDKKARDVRKET
jgi:bifunctional non-homologous end joining protein LigD